MSLSSLLSDVSKSRTLHKSRPSRPCRCVCVCARARACECVSFAESPQHLQAQTCCLSRTSRSLSLDSHSSSLCAAFLSPPRRLGVTAVILFAGALSTADCVCACRQWRSNACVCAPIAGPARSGLHQPLMANCGARRMLRAGPQMPPAPRPTQGLCGYPKRGEGSGARGQAVLGRGSPPTCAGARAEASESSESAQGQCPRPRRRISSGSASGVDPHRPCSRHARARLAPPHEPGQAAHTRKAGDQSRRSAGDQQNSTVALDCGPHGHMGLAHAARCHALVVAVCVG